MPITLILRNPLDRDAREYISRASVTDLTAQTQLNAFARGIKSLGLWSSMVCWPLRSMQNVGTGSTAYSLGGLGTYVGTLVGGPTWGVDGITALGATSQSIDISDAPALRRADSVGLMLVVSTINTVAFSDYGNMFGKSSGGPLYNHNYQINEMQGVRELALGVGDGVASGFVVTVNIGTNTTKNCLIASSRVGGSNKLALNNGGITSSSNTLTQLNSSSTSPLRFNRTGTFARGGEYSFGAMFATDLSDSQIPGLYSLYKQTLGTGLGLP